LSLAFAKISYSFSQKRKLLTADNNQLKQISCEFCNRYYRYRCVSSILKNKKNGKVHSHGLQSPQSTRRLRNAVVMCTRCCTYLHCLELLRQAQEKHGNSGHQESNQQQQSSIDEFTLFFHKSPHSTINRNYNISKSPIEFTLLIIGCTMIAWG